MQLIRTGFAMFCLSLGLFACGEGEVFKPNLEGTYIGEARIVITEERWGRNGGSETIVLIDTAILETITVTASTLSDTTYTIERESNFFSSFYDFERDLPLSDDYEWGAGYEYDKNWKTTFKIDPGDDLLTAYMHVYDIFGTELYDYEADTLIYYYTQDKEYWVEAVR